MSPQSEGDGLEDKVSTFGVDLSDLSDGDIERRAEAYLAEQERRYKESAEAYLRRQERWYKGPAEDYLGFDRGDLVGDRSGVNRGGD